MIQPVMTSNPRNDDQCATQLCVPPARAKFPLSSPISDDQISNRSFDSKKTVNSADLLNSPQSSQNPFEDTESGNTSGQDEFHLERYSESSNWTKGSAGEPERREKSKAFQSGCDTTTERRKKKPGLNIVTDFSRSVKRSLENATINQVPARLGKVEKEKAISTGESQGMIRNPESGRPPADSGFVNLDDLERLRKDKHVLTRSRAKKSVPKQMHKRLRAGQGSTVQERNDIGNNSDMGLGSLRLDGLRDDGLGDTRRDSNGILHLQAPPRKGRQTSPTARSVVIGISVPENEVEAHKPSDEMNSALTLQTPLTPTIVVTPADVTADWVHNSSQLPSMKRAASSIYSQATALPKQPDLDAPPVPSVPARHKQSFVPASELSRRSIDTWETDTPRNQRPFSSETVIDDDELENPEGRPASAGSKDGILPSSADTGRPRSKGWWNLMLSPMLSRAGTSATKKTTSLVEGTPAIPSLPWISPKEGHLSGHGQMSAFSPETPRRAALDSPQNSTWSNWTQWERDRAQGPMSQPTIEGAHVAKSRSPGEDELEQGDRVGVQDPVTRLGLAAEYFQACAFDLLNPVPYFDCVSHDCANALPKLGASGKSLIKNGASDKRLQAAAPISTAGGDEKSSSPPGEPHVRSDSDSTMIEDDPVELSPNVRKALARPILKTKQPQKIEALSSSDVGDEEKAETVATKVEISSVPTVKSATPPPYSAPPAKQGIPRYVGILPPSGGPLPSSPAPMSPEAQRALYPPGAIPMSQVQQPPHTFVNYKTTYHTDLPPRPAVAPVSLSDIENPVQIRQKVEARRRQLEREDAAARKAGGFWRGRGCIPEKGCLGRTGAAGRSRRRWYVVIATILVLMMVLVVVLATQLTRKGDQTPVQSQWLNLTGYPPMPTGISTMARPDVASEVTACVQPSSLWSCALPREDQASNAPGDADQPNLRLEIRFRNGTVDANGTIPIGSSNNNKTDRVARRAAPLRRQKDPFTNSLFEPNPAPPSLTEQTFLGNTTDNITFPFDGEATPFFITFLTSDPSVPEAFNDTSRSPSRLLRRQSGGSSGNIPSPALLADGTAVPANLVPNAPLPYSQPVKLYNRGLPTEHYGFYTYFDRSIFIKNTAQFNSSSQGGGGGGGGNDADNSAGGSLRQRADLRCTWAQTRFLVQIWTSTGFNGQLLPAANGTGSSLGGANKPQDSKSSPAESSATNFDRPGSFPYPVTVKLDRHGGDSSKKGVYCYGMDEQQKIVASEKKLVAEVRDAGGALINAAPGIFSNGGGGQGFDPRAGGIDGGTGGCGCEWRNWAGDGS